MEILVSKTDASLESQVGFPKISSTSTSTKYYQQFGELCFVVANIELLLLYLIRLMFFVLTKIHYEYIGDIDLFCLLIAQELT